MGAAQSGAEGRRVTIENLQSEAMDVVYVSDELKVVRRLTQGVGLELESELGQRKAAPSAPAPTRATIPAPSTAKESGSCAAENAALSRRLAEAEALAGRLKSELGRSQAASSEMAARLNDLRAEARKGLPSGAAEWERKMRELEAKQLELQTSMKSKFKATVEEVSAKFFAHPPTPVCAELEKRVHQCYLDNPRHTLNCSSVAQEFIDCVRAERAAHMARQSPNAKAASKPSAQPA